MRQQQSSSQNQQSFFQSESLSNHTNQTSEAKKQRIDKKRAIRKDKVQPKQEKKQQKKYQKSQLTREQKAQIQKAKNRQAAQKSRDQHKKYVEDLQQQNKQLRKQIDKPKYCQKCLELLQSNSQNSTSQSMMGYEQSPTINTFFKDQNDPEQNANFRNLEDEDFDLDTPFVRMRSGGRDFQESSSFKMLLFVAFIVIGVAVLNVGGNIADGAGNTATRELQEIDSDSKGLKEIEYQNIIEERQKDSVFKKDQSKSLDFIRRFDQMNEMENSFNMEEAQYIEDGIVTDEIMPISPLNQPKCLKSIITRNYTNIQGVQNSYNENNLSSSSKRSTGNQMSVFSPSEPQNKDNILFCSLPKLYRKDTPAKAHSEATIFSKMIDIILSGSEMVEIMGSQSNFWMNKVINFEGLYKINAEIRGVSQIKDANCIL